jgi:hypothetical protein
MSLKRFRIEVEGEDQEDVEQQLDDVFLFIVQGLRNFPSSAKQTWECTAEHLHPIQRNGVPFMYGRRVFKVMEEANAD